MRARRAQGTLGDCWLMSAIAAVAEFEDVVRETFVTEEINAEGKYTVKLFEPYTLPPGAKPPPVKTGDAKREIEGKWRYITVDDFVPCLKCAAAPCTLSRTRESRRRRRFFTAGAFCATGKAHLSDGAGRRVSAAETGKPRAHAAWTARFGCAC